MVTTQTNSNLSINAVTTNMRLKLQKFWLTIGLGFIGLVVFLSLAPDLPDTGLQHGMKIGHILAYCWLMFWFAQVYPTATARYRLAATFCAMGIALEYMQSMSAYRGFEYSDMLIDAFGVGLGFLLSYTRLQHLLARLETLLLRGTA